MDHSIRVSNCFCPFFLFGKEMKILIPPKKRRSQDNASSKITNLPTDCPFLLHRGRVCVNDFYTLTAAVNNEEKQDDLSPKIQVTNIVPFF